MISNASGTLTNTVTVTSDTSDTVSSSIQTHVTTEADLQISKLVSTVNATTGEEINYTIAVLNNGPSYARNVIITDTFDPLVLSDVKYYDSGTDTWADWHGSLNIGTLPNKETYTLYLKGVVTALAADPLANTASVTSDAADPVPGNNTYTINTPLESVTNLSLEITDPVKVSAGERLEYKLTVNNLSQTSVENIDLIMNISNLISNLEYSLDEDSTWHLWTGSLNFPVLASESDQVILMKGDVVSNATGMLNIMATVSSATPDSDLTNNMVTSDYMIERDADIYVYTTVLTHPEEIIAGSIITYEITYGNLGPSDATNVVITSHMPPHFNQCRSFTV